MTKTAIVAASAWGDAPSDPAPGTQPAPDATAPRLSDADYQLLLRTLRMQSASTYRRQSQDDAMRAHVIAEATAAGCVITESHGNVYATKGSADLYPCFVAHLDTVHEILPAGYEVQRHRNGDLIAWNTTTNAPAGIGGDDKCGIMLALAMLRDLPHAKAAFFRDEEMGCVGATYADHGFFADCAFAIEADRRGNGDVIVEASGTELCGFAFESALTPILEQHGFAPTYGAMTDVQQLKDDGLSIACVNVSAGYYLPHRDDTYVRPSDVAKTLNLLRDIAAELSGQQWPHVDAAAAAWRARVASGQDTCPTCGGMLAFDAWCYTCRAYQDDSDSETDSDAYGAHPPDAIWVCPACGEADCTEPLEGVTFWYCPMCDTLYDPTTRETLSPYATANATA